MRAPGKVVSLSLSGHPSLLLCVLGRLLPTPLSLEQGFALWLLTSPCSSLAGLLFSNQSPLKPRKGCKRGGLQGQARERLPGWREVGGAEQAGKPSGLRSGSLSRSLDWEGAGLERLLPSLGGPGSLERPCASSQQILIPSQEQLAKDYCLSEIVKRASASFQFPQSPLELKMITSTLKRKNLGLRELMSFAPHHKIRKAESRPI